MDACDQVRSEGISLRTTVMAQQSEITELQAADRRRQTVILDLLKADHRRQRQLVEALKIVKRGMSGPQDSDESSFSDSRTVLRNCRAEHQRRPKMAPREGPRGLNPLQHQQPVADPTTPLRSPCPLQDMIDRVSLLLYLAARDTTRNDNDSHTSGTGVRRNERAVRECTYQDFMKCQPLFFRGTEGVVDLTQWFERIEKP
ncbi:hypothetical protein Tco_0988493 [Tanacetum coccineum]|uniref:Uncharacterized protein n=1 Tax=Tanacetum coccineum TaxID=301880 RepID=A0ABQ5ERG0_9ASTR